MNQLLQYYLHKKNEFFTASTLADFSCKIGKKQIWAWPHTLWVGQGAATPPQSPAFAPEEFRPSGFSERHCEDQSGKARRQQCRGPKTKASGRPFRFRSSGKAQRTSALLLVQLLPVTESLPPAAGRQPPRGIRTQIRRCLLPSYTPLQRALQRTPPTNHQAESRLMNQKKVCTPTRVVNCQVWRNDVCRTVTSRQKSFHQSSLVRWKEMSC